VEKPGNLGALLRTADAAGVDALLVCDPVTDLTNPNTIRASLGTLFTVPVAVCDEAAARAYLREHGVAICTTRPEAEKLYWERDLRGATALVLGTEDRGLGEAWTGEGVEALRLPMAGAADSLNVNVSAAIVAFEARRQRASAVD
jgi:TrmH family RNA methyltransferase